MSLPPDLRIVPHDDEAAEPWTDAPWAPVWLVVLSDDPDAPEEHVLANAWDGLWEGLAAELAEGDEG